MLYGVQARSQSLWDINLNTQEKLIVRLVSAWELKRVANVQLVT